MSASPLTSRRLRAPDNPVPASREEILAAFKRQADYCRLREAPLTASIIDAAGTDLQAGGPIAGLLQDFDEDPARGALALRIAGAVHYLAIKGRAGPLQKAYRTLSLPETNAVAASLAALAEEHGAVFQSLVSRPPQTNEINRLAALIPAFSEVSSAWGLPVDLYELGTSGGLLLSPDRCSVDYGAFSWGDGPVSLKSDWRGDAHEFADRLEIRGRSGCDRNAIDFTDPEQMDIAHSYIWPEHPERRRTFDAAIAATRDAGARIDRADALQWLAARDIPQPGAVSVVFTSVFAVYLNDDETARLNRLMDDFGARATTDAPVAFIQFEPEPELDFVTFNVDLTIWPGRMRRRIATAHAHGAWVEPVPD